MEVAVLGIDLGKKNICSLTGFDGCGLFAGG
jgi:hypothetical protein